MGCCPSLGLTPHCLHANTCNRTNQWPGVARSSSGLNHGGFCIVKVSSNAFAYSSVGGGVAMFIHMSVVWGLPILAPPLGHRIG